MYFIDELDQGTASLTDKEFAMLKRMIEERRGRNAAHATVAPIDTARPCSPRSRSSEISFDVRVRMEQTTTVGWTQSDISSNHHRLVRI